MNNHQYSPDKAQVIVDESLEAGLGPRGGLEMDISERRTARVSQQSSTSFHHHSSTSCSTMPCVLHTYPHMPCVLHTYPHISRGTTATFSSSTPSTDYATNDEIIRRVKNVGSYSTETFGDLHWGDFCYALTISTDADSGRVPRVAGDRYKSLLRRIIRDDVPGTDTRSIWEKRCLWASAGLNHELLKVIDEQQNEVCLWAMV